MRAAIGLVALNILLLLTCGEDWFAKYRDVDEIDAFIDRFPNHVIGTSFEGRPIRAIALGRGDRTIVIDGGQHAREWLSVMVPMCIADRLARDEKLLDRFRFEIVPLVNPDGYAHTWTTDRMWRKNRRGTGVDLNRNYDIAWGGSGASHDPKSPNYCGKAPFSEPESRALASLFDEPVFGHIDFHAYSQVIVYPWSHTKTPPRDREQLAAIADRMSAAMTAAHDHRYVVRAGAELSSPVTGTAADWSYAHGALAFLVELRPASSRDGGFDVPPENIAPACDEGYAAVMALTSR